MGVFPAVPFRDIAKGRYLRKRPLAKLTKWLIYKESLNYKYAVALLSLNLLITLSLVLPLTVQATPRADELLCEEVAYALYEAVYFGTISLEVAEHVIDGCYTNYLPNYQ